MTDLLIVSGCIVGAVWSKCCCDPDPFASPLQVCRHVGCLLGLEVVVVERSTSNLHTLLGFEARPQPLYRRLKQSWESSKLSSQLDMGNKFIARCCSTHKFWQQTAMSLHFHAGARGCSRRHSHNPPHPHATGTPPATYGSNRLIPSAPGRRSSGSASAIAVATYPPRQQLSFEGTTHATTPCTLTETTGAANKLVPSGPGRLVARAAAHYKPQAHSMRPQPFMDRAEPRLDGSSSFEP